MPVTIGEVESTIEVEGSASGSGQTSAGRVLPGSRETARLAQLQRHLQWDEARTAAHDFDD